MADSNSTPSSPDRIAVDRRALPALLALKPRLTLFGLTIETDSHGDTRVFLERLSRQEARQ